MIVKCQRHSSTLDSPATSTHSKAHDPMDTTLPIDDQATVNTDKVTAPPPLTGNHKDTL